MCYHSKFEYAFLKSPENLSKGVSYKTILSLFSISIFSQRVLDEHAKYDDILQADMVDHYNNLTLKSVFTLKFFLNESNFNSPPPFHMMKIDNDVYLNVPQLQFIVNDPTHMLKLGLNSKSPMYLIGHRCEIFGFFLLSFPQKERKMY